jgi:surface antigen
LTEAGANGPDGAGTNPSYAPLTRRQLRLQEQANGRSADSSVAADEAAEAAEAVTGEAVIQSSDEVIEAEIVVEADEAAAPVAETEPSVPLAPVVVSEAESVVPPAAVQAPAAPVAPSVARTVPVRTGPIRTSSSAKPGSKDVAVRKPKKTGARPGSVRGIATMAVLVPALLATVALPAYAASTDPKNEFGTSASASLKASGAQSVVVSDQVADTNISRDAYTATTPDELAQRQRQLDAAAAVTNAKYSIEVSAARAEGDDYPWYNMPSDNEGGGLSPLRYYYRECVDFVAWRLNRDAGTPDGNWAFTWGNGLPPSSAYGWSSSWQYKQGTTAIAGSVAWFTYNHVAYVQAVNADGTVVLEEYNYGANKHAYNVRVVPASSVASYLYPPGVG